MSIDFIKCLLFQRFDSIRDQFIRGKLIMLPKPLSKIISEKISVTKPIIETDPIINLSDTKILTLSIENSPIFVMEDIINTSTKVTTNIQIEEENILIPGPLADSECVCCKLHGDRKVF